MAVSHILRALDLAKIGCHKQTVIVSSSKQTEHLSFRSVKFGHSLSKWQGVRRHHNLSIAPVEASRSGDADVASRHWLKGSNVAEQADKRDEIELQSNGNEELPLAARSSSEKTKQDETSRRSVVWSLAATVASIAVLSDVTSPRPAEASQVQKVVKLKNVENQQLQDALRAAVAGDLARADRLFTDLINDYPDSASNWSNRGSVRLSMERFEDAAEDFTKAVQLAPYAPVPFLNRAIAYEALGRFQEAVADCRSAIENDPDEYAAWFNLGNVEAKLRDYSGALQAYERAALLAPGIAGYRLREAQFLFQLERVGEAEKVMQGLVRKYPNYAEAHASLAAVLWSENRRGVAEEQFTEATLQEPKFKNMEWVKATLQWPPSMESALQNFLAIK